MTNLAEARYAEPKFTNASKILALCDAEGKEHLRYIRVKDKTANITNGSMLIRRYVDAPDGLYDCDINGRLMKASVLMETALRYPDLELVRPPFETMRPLALIPRAVIEAMIPLCHQAVSDQGTISIDATGACIKQNVSLGVPFQFNLPSAVNLNPKFLEVTLIEMLQYPSVYLLREMRSGDRVQRTPLVFGVDWGSCALIMPFEVNYD